MVPNSQASLTYFSDSPCARLTKYNLEYIILSTTKDQHYFLYPAKRKDIAEVVAYTFQRLTIPTFFKVRRLGTREINDLP